MQSARKLCAENDPGSEHWSEASFVGRLTEHCDFDRGLYATLVQSIEVIAASRTVEDVWCLLRILERVTLLTGCHLHPADVYRIDNLQDEEVVDFNNDFRNLLRDLSLQRQGAS